MITIFKLQISRKKFTIALLIPVIELPFDKRLKISAPTLNNMI